MRFVVLYGSTRSDRDGIKAARFMVRSLQGRGHDVSLIDALELGLPMLDKMHKEYADGDAPEAMQRAHDLLDDAQGYVLVGGEWNHSVPGPLKNMIDHFQQEYYFKPCGIVTYSAGPFGGVRAAVHYRAILGELGMVSPSIMFPVSRVGKAFDEEGNDVTAKKDYEHRVGRFLDELEWYTEALAAKREKDGTPY